MIIDRVLIDFETRSSAPITSGPNRYAADRHARAWCASWGFRADGGSWVGPCITIIDGGRAGVVAVSDEMVRCGYDVRPLDEFLWVCDRARVRVAHNAPFEAAIFRWTLDRDYPIESWSCTLARSTRLGLPPALEGVLQVLGAPVAKDMEGNALSKKMGAPIGYSADGSPLWIDDFGSVVRCAKYCVTDFIGEAWLDDMIPELEPREQAIFVRQTKENNRGLNIDWNLVANGRAVTAATVEFVNRELPSWTGGELKSITQPGALLNWVRRRGVDADSLDAETLDLLLDSHPDLPDDVRVVLTARRSIRTSAAKLDALLARRMPDWCGVASGRVCDLTQYGAARTLRTVGRGFQPLNLPRPGDVDVEKGLVALKAMDFDGMLQAVSKDARTRQPSDKAGVKTFKGPRAYVFPTEVVAACLRATVIPAPGYMFVAVDYSGVEARGVLAMAMETTAVQMFLDGADIYSELAQEIYGYPVNKHDNVEERQLGKQGILGAGFGMSRPLTFVDTCKGYGIYIDELMGERVIKAYSTKFPKAVDLWFSLHRSAKSAMNNPETWIGDKKYGVYYFHIPAGKWLGGIPWLLAWLPSGRIMYYPGARMLAGEWGEFISVMSWKNKRWISQTLTRQVTIENVIQAICRDAMEDDKADIVAAFEADPRGPVNHVVLTVYDEILGEIRAEDCEQIVGEGKHAMSAPQSWMEGVMTRPLPWFPLMPRGAEGWTGTEYRK